jgi:TolB-like protein
VTGRVPFEGDTPLSIAMKHKGEIARNPKHFNPSLPDDLCGVIIKCLEKDAGKRYQAAAEIRSELQRIETGIPGAEQVVPEKKPLSSREITVKFSLKKLLWPGLSIAVLAILAAILWRGFIVKKVSPAPEKPSTGILALPEAKNSIAVLPLKNLSPEPGQDYFCDGMTDELISKLSKVQSLRVISRNSIFTFKNSQKSTKAIAQELQVKNILDGSVRKAGEKIRISVQLIDAETDAPVWSDTYDKNLENIFDMQDAVAQAIVDALRLKLTPGEAQAIAERAINDPYAYECYLRASDMIYSASSSYSNKGLDQAYQEIEKALNAIGDNVLLYSTLGSLYYQYVNRGINREENLKKAEETAAKIFLLEPDSSYGYKLLGMIQLRLGKAREAARYLKKALVSNPGDAEALGWLYYVYEQAGRMEEARQADEWLSRIDPVFNPPGKLGVYFYLMDGQFERALKTLETSRRSDPLGQIFETWLLALNNRTKEALERIDKLAVTMAELGPEMDYGRDWVLFFKYGLQKKREQALACATEELKKVGQTDEQISWMLADCYALIGEKEEAMNWLENAVNRGFVNYPYISQYNRFLKNIRGEARFKELLKQVKYEWEHFEV